MERVLQIWQGINITKNLLQSSPAEYSGETFGDMLLRRSMKRLDHTANPQVKRTDAPNDTGLTRIPHSRPCKIYLLCVGCVLILELST